MKKKVLFALIALFSFLSSWAQDVTTVVVQAGGGYTAKFLGTETWVAAGEGLPEVVTINYGGEALAAGTTISPALDGTYEVFQKVSGVMTKVVSTNGPSNKLSVGNYYLKFTLTGENTMKIVYVPFQVYEEVPAKNGNTPGYEFIWNKATFDASVASGALKLYYDAYTPDQATDPEGYAAYTAERNDWYIASSVNHDMYTGATNGGHPEGFPWIVFEAPTSGSYKVQFAYDDPAINENNPCNPWSEKPVQTFGTGTNDRKFGVASVVERTSFHHYDWLIGYQAEGEAPNIEYTLVGLNPNPDALEEGAFDISKFHMYWTPAEGIDEIVENPVSTNRTDISGWTWALPVITFNGYEQNLDAFFTSGEAKVVENASNLASALTFGTDFTATYDANDNYTNAGEGKTVTITGIGAYKGSFTKDYTIAPYELTAADFWLNPAGPEFAYDGTNKAPAVEGKGVVTPVAPGTTADPTSKVALTAADFDAVLKKGTAAASSDVDAAVEAGSYFYVVTPKGNYKTATVDNQAVVITLPFTVTGMNLSNTAVVTMPQVGEPAANGYVYNTKVQKPVFTTTSTATFDATVKYNKGTEADPVWVTLAEGTDFTVAWTENGDYTNVGQKSFIINFMGSYEGETEVNYDIVAKNIADTDVSKGFTAPTYNPSGVAQITADNFDFEYNDVALVLGQEAAGDFSWAWKEGSNGESGSQTIVVTGKGNYTGTWEKTFQVKAYAVTITPATAHKVYGEKDPAPNFSIDANSALQIEYGGEEWQYIQRFLVMERNINDANNSDALRETVVEGGHKYSINYKETEEPCNYEIIIQNNDGILFIDPAPLTVHVANNSKTYGEPDPSFIADKSDTEKFQILSGDEDVTNAKDFVDKTKNLKEVLNIGRVAGEDVKDSPYDFTWDNPNYTVTFEPVGFTINPKQVTIEVAFDGNGYEYKGAEWNPMPTVTIKNTDTQLVNPKDFAISWAAGDGLNDLINVTEGGNVNGNRWPSATVTQVTNGNYTFTSVQAYFKITKATLEIAAIADNSKAYTGQVNTDPSPLALLTFATDKGPKGRDTYTNGQFNFTFTKPLIIREKAGTVEGEHTGNYEISINPEAKTRNYNIVSTATANFLIYRTDEIVIKFNPNPKDITYGDALDLTTLITYEAPAGVDLSDLKADVEKNVKKYQYIDPETGEVDNVNGEKTFITTNNVGTYHLTIDDYPTAYKNYDVRLVEGILNIKHYPLFIRSVDSKEYGDDEPADYAWDVYEYVQVGNTWQYVKFTRDEIEVPEADLIGNSGNYFEDMYRYTISRERGEDVGHYATTIRDFRFTFPYGSKSYGTQYDGNYSFQLAPGDFEITRRALTVEVTGASKFYGEYDPVQEEGVWTLSEDLDENEDDNVSVFTKGFVTITVTNALPRDVEWIANKVTFTGRDAGEVVKAGGYTVKNVNFDGLVNPGATRLANYTLSYSNTAKFMINKRVLKVIAHDQSVPYAQPLVIEPYDLTITEGILLDDVYTAGNPKGVKYFDNVTTMPKTIATDGKQISDQVDEVFKPLEVVEGKTAVGVFHRDAFKLELTEFGAQNYELEFTNGKLYIEQATDLYLDMANLAQALNDHKGRKVTLHMIGAPVKEEGCDPFRRFGENRWYTLVLPFKDRVRNIVKPFEYAVIDILNIANTNANEFSLAITTTELEANTPFVIQPDERWNYNRMATVEWKDVTIADFDYLNADPTSTDAAGNKFIGTYKPKSDFTAANYIMKGDTGDFFRFVAGEDGVEPSYAMKQTEAYLEAPDANGAPARIIIEEADGTTTAIEFVGAEAVTTTSAAEGWYTINGVKLNAEPTTPGTYIFNGKKVYIK
jgi:hypothetical protein